jgi:hypothetical protein
MPMFRSSESRKPDDGGFKPTNVERSTLILQRAGFGKDREKRGDEQGKGEVVQGLECHNLKRG